MKIKLIKIKNQFDTIIEHILYVDDLPSLSIDNNMETEDAFIGRDLIDCEHIIKYMKLAYKAGKNNEEFALIIEDK